MKITIRDKDAGVDHSFCPRPSDDIDGPAGPFAAAEPPDADQLARLLSPDGRRIVAALVGRGPMPVKSLYPLVNIERTRCYTLVGDLAERGILRDGPDGYEVADAEVRRMLATPTG